MERPSEDRDIGMPNSSINYNNSPSQINQEITPPLKLPLAPIVSTPSDRRANPTVTLRRGSSIFSPVQTLDHHQHLHPHPPRQQERDDDPIPDPDPASTSAGGASNSKTPSSPPTAAADAAASSAVASPVIRYRECLKNHAASMGGHVVDGCGEFMPSGEEGSAEALRCAACDCHRNFHRKEAEGGGEPPQQSHYYSYTPNSGNNTNTHSRNPFFQTPGPTPPTMVNFGGGSSSGAAGESSSEDLNMFQSSGGGHAVNRPSFSGSKKRFRTKFSQEQKNRMQELAEKLGWRIQKQDEQEVEKFSNETGIKRQVFKVWMHNNKQAMKKR